MDGNGCKSKNSATQQCFPKKATFDEAEEACADAGLRLCTQPELESDMCCSTGCEYDNLRMWSSTPAVGHMSGPGCKADNTWDEWENTLDTDTEAVRCCSENSAGEAICRSQDAAGECFPMWADFDRAEKKCEKAGMRLCTEEELDSGICCSTGCEYDGRRVWSSTAGHR
jgi:hypothetical protein